MMNRWHDCHCEDFPCCGHYDTGDPELSGLEYCDRCGYEHSTRIDCSAYDPDDDDDEDPDTDDEDVIALRHPQREADQDFARATQGVIEAFEEFDMNPPWVIDIDYDRGEVFDD